VNPFEQHGIKHLSASSLNTWAAEPAMWVLQKLAGKQTPAGFAAHRGTASESGIVAGLLQPAMPIVEAQQIALDQFDSLSAMSKNPKALKERAAIPGIVEQGIKKLRVAGIPDEVQQKINVTLPDIPVPFIGFVDLGWTTHGIRLDIKSKLRMPSDIEQPHRRQVGLYIHGTNCTGRVAYFSPTQEMVFALEDAPRYVEELRQVAIRMQNFLALSDDREKLIRACVPNYNSFYWSDEYTRQLGKEVFGV
jgi:hypothetical protein